MPSRNSGAGIFFLFAPAFDTLWSIRAKQWQNPDGIFQRIAEKLPVDKKVTDGIFRSLKFSFQ
nr:MAG TPA: hypothetical protein [Caudoviricetes sp.]